MAGIIGSVLPLTSAFGTIGDGAPTTTPEPAMTAISRAESRVHDLAGGATGDFDVSIGGGYSNYVYIGALCFLIYMIAKVRK